jgi:predicted nucleic acid-binding Zn ribbon protein
MTHKTNAERVHDLMTESEAGPLMQAFVLEAIRRYADQVLADGEPADNPRAFISPAAWHRCAQAARLELADLEGGRA